MDIIFEFYLELMMQVVPEEKSVKRHQVLIVAILSLGIILALAMFGLHLLLDKSNAFGWIPIGAAIALSVAQIVFGIIACSRRK